MISRAVPDVPLEHGVALCDGDLDANLKIQIHELVVHGLSGRLAGGSDDTDRGRAGAGE